MHPLIFSRSSTNFSHGQAIFVRFSKPENGSFGNFSADQGGTPAAARAVLRPAPRRGRFFLHFFLCLRLFFLLVSHRVLLHCSGRARLFGRDFKNLHRIRMFFHHWDRLAGQLFDPGKALFFCEAAERNRCSRLSGAPGTPDPVHIGLRYVRQVVVKALRCRFRGRQCRLRPIPGFPPL